MFYSKHRCFINHQRDNQLWFVASAKNEPWRLNNRSQRYLIDSKTAAKVVNFDCERYGDFFYPRWKFFHLQKYSRRKKLFVLCSAWEKIPQNKSQLFGVSKTSLKIFIKFFIHEYNMWKWMMMKKWLIRKIKMFGLIARTEWQLSFIEFTFPSFYVSVNWDFWDIFWYFSQLESMMNSNSLTDYLITDQQICTKHEIHLY